MTNFLMNQRSNMIAYSDIRGDDASLDWKKRSQQHARTAGEIMPENSIPLEDRAAIWDLIARYSFAIDSRDVEAVLACYTDEAEFRSADGAMHAQGKAALRAMLTQELPRAKFQNHVMHHNLTTPGVCKDSANGLVSAHVELDYGSGMQIFSARYEDLYARSSGEWRFQRRQITFLNAP